MVDKSFAPDPPFPDSPVPTGELPVVGFGLCGRMPGQTLNFGRAILGARHPQAACTCVPVHVRVHVRVHVSG